MSLMMTVPNKLIRILAFLFLLCAGLYITRSFLIPVTYGVLMAMLLAPLCSWFERKGTGKALAALLCVLLFIVVVSGVIALLTWQIADLSHDIDQISVQLNQLPEKAEKYIHRTLGLTVEQQAKLVNEQIFSSGTGFKLALLANSALSLLGKSLLVLVYIFLFLYYRRHLENFILRLVSTDHKEKVKQMIFSSGHLAQQYISGIGMMIGILWVMYGVGFSIIGVRHAILFAVLCGLLEIMPYVGNLTGTLVTAIMAYTQGGVDMALWIVLVYLIVQFTQTYILEPLVLGARVSINPLCTIVAIIVGEMIWGISGMVLAIPLLGIVKIICDNVPSLRPIGFLIGTVKYPKRSGTFYK